MCNLFDIVRVEVLCFDGGFIDFNLVVALRFVVKCWVSLGYTCVYFLPVTLFLFVGSILQFSTSKLFKLLTFSSVWLHKLFVTPEEKNDEVLVV